MIDVTLGYMPNGGESCGARTVGYLGDRPSSRREGHPGRVSFAPRVPRGEGGLRATHSDRSVRGSRPANVCRIADPTHCDQHNHDREPGDENQQKEHRPPSNTTAHAANELSCLSLHKLPARIKDIFVGLP
jgi:hypothetical protein